MFESRDNEAMRDQQVTMGEGSNRLAELEGALLAGCPVEECVVLPRKGENGIVELVAYVVPSFPYSHDRLEALVRSKMPCGEVPCFCVPVASIPLTESGDVDESALIGLPVIEEGLLEKWNERLRALPNIRQGIATTEECATDQTPLHISELIPDWKSAVTKASEVAGEVTQEMAESAGEPQSRPFAWADGGPLVIPTDAPKTFTEAILRTAKEFPHKGILHVKADGEEVFQSYPTLLEEACRVLAGLRAKGLKPGSRAILQLQSLADHFSSFWACVLGGITPVNVAVASSYAERNAIVSKLYNVWKLLEHPAVIASDHLVSPLCELERLFPGEKFKILSVGELKNHSATDEIYESKPEDLVFFQLTSGSTGVPKCIQQSHQSIIAHIHGSGQFNGYSPNDVCLNWLPVDHVVPTLTYNLKDVYLGCQEIQVETNLILSDPLRWLDLIEKYRVTHTWAPNFGFKLVSERLASAEGRKWDLSSIKFFMNAGEQVTFPVVREFLERVAPFGVSQRAMQPSFGMAEACTCMTYANDFSFATGAQRFLKSSIAGLLQPTSAEDSSAVAFVDLGPPVPGVQIRITDGNNQVLPEGRIGRFQIKGDVITPGYLYNEEANREAFVGDGWFNSGDLGFILGGRLTLTGREKEMIIVRGANFYCYEIEDVINGIPGVVPTFTGSCGVSDPATGTEGLAIFFVPQESASEEKIRLIHEIRSVVASNFGITPAVIVPLPKSEFPKTTSGKIQRNQLRKSLAAGLYDPILKEIDIALGNANTLPNWFYRKIWRHKQIMPRQTPVGNRGWLILLDSSGLGERLCAKLTDSEQPWVRVAAGSEFEKLHRQSYRIDPTNPEHYRRLLVSIAEDGIPLGQILHLTSYLPFTDGWENPSRVHGSLDEGLFPLLFLIQALSSQSEFKPPACLFVASSHTQHISAGDKVDCTRSIVLGLLKTVSQEIQGLTARHVDLPGKNIDEDANLFFSEIQSGQADREVAWRDSCRWVPRLEPVDFRTEPKNPLPFQRGGLYLMSGGLGGVGYNIAKYLLENYQARLLILGRTPVPARNRWDDHLAMADAVSDRLRVLQELERSGDVSYEAADICDFPAVEAAVERARDRWQSELAGIIHLAGLYRECQLSEETKQSFASVLRPKVLGSLALSRLLRNRPGALFLSFSSVNGFLGGFSVGAYSAANAFLDSFAEYQRETQGIESHCLAWSIWNETGMSRGFAMNELARTRGYHSILPQQGIRSCVVALHQQFPQLLIGLDASKPSIRRYLEQNSCGSQELMAYLVSEDGNISLEKLKELSVEDRYGTPTRCKARRVERIPLTPSGEVDRQQLSLEAHGARPASEPPRTAVEKELADIWTAVLGVERISRNDNFFALGGHSLSAVQITFKIQQRFKINFPLQAFAQAPGLARQAQQIEERLLEQAEATELEKLIDEIEQIRENRGKLHVEDQQAGRQPGS